MWRDHSGASDVLEKVRSKLNAKISRVRLTSMRCITTTASNCAASLSHCSGGSHSKSHTLSLQLTSSFLPVPSLTLQIHYNGAPLHHRLRPQEVRRILRKRHKRRPMGTIVLSTLTLSRHLTILTLRSEQWRYTGPFTRFNRFKGSFPGLGIATVAFGVYLAAEQAGLLKDEGGHHSETT
jgi:hypothetical protein